MQKIYRINKIFFSIQGEGKRVGTPQVFVRFSGCNMKCPFCDTDHEPFDEMTAEQIVQTCLSIAGNCRSVSFCGGEPTLQLDEELIKAFDGWYKSIETNGTHKVPQGIDYIVCSPKTSRIEPDNIDELRFVIKAGDPLPTPCKTAKRMCLSPCFDGDRLVKENLYHCIRLVQENPSWLLSLQWHKFIGIE